METLPAVFVEENNHMKGGEEEDGDGDEDEDEEEGEDKAAGQELKVRPKAPQFFSRMDREVFYYVGQEIVIREALDSYAGLIWPANPSLCHYLDTHREQIDLVDKAVLEIGAGTGLLSVVAALLGAWVTATDLPEVLGNLRANLCRNTSGLCRHTPQVAALSWGHDLERTYPGSVYHYDYVLAADVVYHHDCLDELLATMKHFCRPGTTLIWANKVRFETDLTFTENFKKAFRTSLLAEDGEMKIFKATCREGREGARDGSAQIQHLDEETGEEDDEDDEDDEDERSREQLEEEERDSEFLCVDKVFSEGTENNGLTTEPERDDDTEHFQMTDEEEDDEDDEERSHEQLEEEEHDSEFLCVDKAFSEGGDDAKQPKQITDEEEDEDDDDDKSENDDSSCSTVSDDEVDTGQAHVEQSVVPPDRKPSWIGYSSGLNKDIYHYVGNDIVIYESIDSYGAVMWPAALALCSFLDNNRRTLNLRDMEVLELGAGTGLVTVVASMLGALVTATDLPDVMGNLQANVMRNTRGRCRHMPKVETLSWGHDLERTHPGSVHPYDYVLAADVVYHHDCLDELLATMRHFCRPGTTLIWANKVRFETDLTFTENFKKAFHTTLLAEDRETEMKIFKATYRERQDRGRDG